MKKLSKMLLGGFICAGLAANAAMEFRPATLDEAIAQMTDKGFGTINVEEITGITTEYSKTIKADKPLYHIELSKDSQTSANVWIEASSKRGHAVDYDAAKLVEKLKALGFVEGKDGSWALDHGAITGKATFGDFATSLINDDTIKLLRIEFRYQQPTEKVKLWE